MSFIRLFLMIILISPFAVLSASACESQMGRKIIDKLINNQLNHAEKILSHQLIRQPNDPMIGFYQGAILWAKSGEGINKKLAQDALETLNKGIINAQKKLSKTPNNSKLRLNSGMSQMLVARIHAGRKQWLTAYKNGKRARFDLQLLVQNFPHEKDALLGLGLFEFYTGSVPSGLRWLAKLMRFSGDKQKGIQLIHNAVTESPSFGPEAGRTIINEIIYSGSTKLCQYLGLAKELRAKYPNNPQFSFGYQKIFNACGYPQQALNDNKRARKQFSKYNKILHNLNIHQLYIFSNLGNIEKIKSFKGRSKADSYHRSIALGMAYDITRERKKAIQSYSNAKKVAVSKQILNKKIKYLKEPYKKPSPQPIATNYPVAKGCG